MRLWHILPALGCSAVAIACGFAEILRSPGNGHVVLTYTGPTTVNVNERIPVSVTVTVNGTSFSNPRLFVTSSDTTKIALSPGFDTLIVRAIGLDTLTISFVTSIFTDSLPTIQQPVRVNP